MKKIDNIIKMTAKEVDTIARAQYIIDQLSVLINDDDESITLYKDTGMTDRYITMKELNRVSEILESIAVEDDDDEYKFEIQ